MLKNYPLTFQILKKLNFLYMRTNQIIKLETISNYIIRLRI